MKKILLTLGCFAVLSDVSAMGIQPEGTNDESKTVAVAPVQAEEPAQAVVSEEQATETITSSTIVIEDNSENEEVSSPKAKIAKLENASDEEDKDEVASPKANEEENTSASVESTEEESKEVVAPTSPKADGEEATTASAEQPTDESEVPQSTAE